LQNFDDYFESVWLGTGVAYCVSCLLTKARKEFIFCKTIRTTVVWWPMRVTLMFLTFFEKKKRFETKTILLSFRKSFLNKNNFVLNILFSFRKHFHLFAN